MKKVLVSTILFIFYSTVLFAQWTQQVSPIAPNYNSVHFFNENNGWAFGASGSVKTTDGGIIWSDQSTNISFKKVSVVDENTAFALVGDKLVYRTLDGGTTWILRTTPAWAPPVTTLDGIAFVSSTVGYVGGTNGYIFKTIDGGGSWSLVSSGGFYVSDLYFLDANTGFSCRWGGQWGKTVDGGANWSGGVNGANNFYSVFALDANNVFLGGANGLVYKTVDGGANWTLGSTNTNEILYDVRAVSTLKVWATGANGTIIYSDDGANTWLPQASGIAQTIKGLFFVNANLGWAVGDGGKILKYTSAPVGTITVTSPNGGESWKVGSNQNITWTSSNVTNVKLEYSADNGTNWTQVIASTPAAAGTYNWVVPNAPTTQALVRISEAADNTIKDQSNAVFTIYTPTITVTSPNGGENWKVGTNQNITWTSSNVTNVKLEYSADNGTNWTQIIASTPAAAGTYNWAIPNAPTTQALVRISDAADNTIKDQSNAVFTIYTPTITVTSPNGGENWKVGTNQNITWTSSNVTNVKLEYSADNGTNWTQIIASTPAAAGTYNWVVPNAPTTQALVRINDAADNTIKDQSNAVFTIYDKTVTVISPNGGENWEIGTNKNITWTSSGVANVKIEYSTNNGTNWTTIIASTPAAAGTYNWLINSTPTTQGLVRISDSADGTTNDVSNATFTIPAPTVTLTSPNGGENWFIGTRQDITWTSTSIPSLPILMRQIIRDN